MPSKVAPHQNFHTFSSVVWMITASINSFVSIFGPQLMEQDQWLCQRSTRWQLSFRRSVNQEAKHLWVILGSTRPQGLQLQNLFCYCCTFTCLTLPLFSDTRHGVKDVEGSPLPLMQCDCLMDISVSLDIFACELLWRWSLILFCLT